MPLLDLANELKEEAGGKENQLFITQVIMEDDAAHWEGETHSSHDASLFARLPDDASFQSLFKLYFRHVAPFSPIIHRATFEAQTADRLHQRSPSQARLVLMICAVASVYKPQMPEHQRHPPGWNYFSAVRAIQNELTLTNAAKLIDVQIIAASHRYTRTITAAANVWCSWKLSITT